MYSILLVEDEFHINELLKETLEKEGYGCVQAFSGTEARMLLEKYQYDVVLLDLMLPGIPGEEVLKEVRRHGKTPTIVLTAKDTIDSKVEFLRNGADDYITKPFQMLELVARVKAQLRRVTKYNQQDVKMNENVIIIGGLVVDKENHECTINDEPLSLTPTEFSILWVLCKNRGKVVDSEKLFEEVWGEKYFVNSTNTIMVHIRHLRDKMNDSAENPKYIKTVWGVGYKIEG